MTCWLWRVVGWLVRDDDPYRPDPAKRRWITGMEKPDRRYAPLPAREAQRRAELVRLASAGYAPPTEESIALAKAYQQRERRRAGLTAEGERPTLRVLH